MSARGGGESRHGGALLARCLEAQGVERAFSVPGESFLAALDGLRDSAIKVVTARQEGGAAMMAEATGKVTGRPGVAFCTRGPGATNASSGVHVAKQDSTPMVLFIGQVASDQRDREAFQEVDYRAMFAPLAKWVAEIDRVDRIPEYVSHAFHRAQAGRPGPVVLALPEDMLSSAAPDGLSPVPAATLPCGRAAQADIAEALRRIGDARRPFAILGGSAWSKAAAEAVAEFAERLGIPVGTSFRRQDRLDNDHPCYSGDVAIGVNPALAQRVRDADLLLSLGARLGEIATSGYTLVSPPVPGQSLVHVFPDPSELGRVFRPDLAIAARPGEFAIQLAEASRDALPSRPARSGLVEDGWLASARRDYEAWREPQDSPGDLKLGKAIAHLREALPPEAIVTNGAGNYAAWLHRHFRYRAWGTQVAPTSGSMGYGLPAAIAAKLAHPGRDVVCLAGDGCFQMTSQEFATARAENLGIVVLVCDNGMYGTIRMHQERKYPGRVSGTGLANPDFAALARAHGGFGAIVETTDAFPGALSEAREAAGNGIPALLHLKLDPRALSPSTTLPDGSA